MFLTSLIIEKYYGGKFKWIVVLVLTIIMIVFLLRIDIVITVLNAFLKDLSVKQLALILLGGFLSGVFITSICIFFRLKQMILQKLMSLF